MKDTIKAKDGFRVIRLGSRVSRMEICVIFDGDKPLFMAQKRSYIDYQDEKSNNECFRECEVFTTAKGSQFIYWRDEEIGEDYITKAEALTMKEENQ